MTSSGRTSDHGDGVPEEVRELLIRESVTAMGRTAPNPAVGAVVRARRGNFEQLFSGGTEVPGGRHAEIVALDAAVEAGFQPIEIFVTLEPCSTFGRTAPCTGRILKEGNLTRIIFITHDPLLAGEGERILTQAGRYVGTSGQDTDIPRAFLGGFLQRAGGAGPRFHFKSAVSADGFIGKYGGRVMISGAEARTLTMVLRAKMDAVLVGPGTIRSDRPRLDVRPVLLADDDRALGESGFGKHPGTGETDDVFLGAVLQSRRTIYDQLSDPVYQPDRVFLLGRDFPGSTEWVTLQKEVTTKTGRPAVYAVIEGCEKEWKERVDFAGVLPRLEASAFGDSIREFCASRGYNEVLIEPGRGLLRSVPPNRSDRLYVLQSRENLGSERGIGFALPSSEEIARIALGADTLILRRPL